MKSLLLSGHSQTCISSSILQPLLMYCTLTWQVLSLATMRNAIWLAVSIPAHFELAFPRWDAFRSGNTICSFCRISHYHFATQQSPTLFRLVSHSQTLYLPLAMHMRKGSGQVLYNVSFCSFRFWRKYCMCIAYGRGVVFI